MGLRSLRLAAVKTFFAGSRPLNLRLHMATRQGFNGPACKSLFAGLPGSKATRQGFTRFSGSSKLAFGRLQNPFRGARPQNLHMHMATRESKATRQGFMGLRSLRLAGFKTFSRGPGVKTFACTWLQGTLRPPGKVLWAFEACVWPPSKPFSRGPGL